MNVKPALNLVSTHKEVIIVSVKKVSKKETRQMSVSILMNAREIYTIVTYCQRWFWASFWTSFWASSVWIPKGNICVGQLGISLFRLISLSGIQWVLQIRECFLIWSELAIMAIREFSTFPYLTLSSVRITSKSTGDWNYLERNYPESVGIIRQTFRPPTITGKNLRFERKFPVIT